MADVSWFSKKEIISALNKKHPTLSVPGEIAIAHHLIKSWATGELRI
jgi:NADH pyrophosphatase NudC (nudix superfamily)